MSAFVTVRPERQIVHKSFKARAASRRRRARAVGSRPPPNSTGSPALRGPRPRPRPGIGLVLIHACRTRERRYRAPRAGVRFSSARYSGWHALAASSTRRARGERARAVPVRVRLAPLQRVHGDERDQLERVHAALPRVRAQTPCRRRSPPRVPNSRARESSLLCAPTRRAHLRRPAPAKQAVDARGDGAARRGRLGDVARGIGRICGGLRLRLGPELVTQLRANLRANLGVYLRARLVAELSAHCRLGVTRARRQRETFSSRSNDLARRACATEVAACASARPRARPARPRARAPSPSWTREAGRAAGRSPRRRW